LFQLFTQAFILVRRKKLFGIPVAFNWVMFDIFMAHADGRAEHLMSVGYLTQAQEMARQLSYLTPGEYFGYFERSERGADPFSTIGSRIVDMPNNSGQWRLRDERTANKREAWHIPQAKLSSEKADRALWRASGSVPAVGLQGHDYGATLELLAGPRCTPRHEWTWKVF
jgi:hypothetical protein